MIICVFIKGGGVRLLIETDQMANKVPKTKPQAMQSQQQLAIASHTLRMIRRQTSQPFKQFSSVFRGTTEIYNFSIVGNR